MVDKFNSKLTLNWRRGTVGAGGPIVNYTTIFDYMERVDASNPHVVQESIVIFRKALHRNFFPFGLLADTTIF